MKSGNWHKQFLKLHGLMVEARAFLEVRWQRIHLAIQEIWVWSLGQQDPPEEEMAAHSSILAWRIPWTDEPGRLQSMGVAKNRVRLSNWVSTHTQLMEASTSKQRKFPHHEATDFGVQQTWTWMSPLASYMILDKLLISLTALWSVKWRYGYLPHRAIVKINMKGTWHPLLASHKG